MNPVISTLIILAVFHYSNAGPLRLTKRAAFYIANETACVVDNIVYSNGDPIPTDDPCESCKCRPPGFACVLKDCQVKPGCREVRRAGHCCPDYICETIATSLEGKNPFISEKEPSLETTYIPSSEIVPGVTYVEEVTQPPVVDATIIEIFEPNTDETADSQPEAVDLYAVVAEETPDSRENLEPEPEEVKILPSTLTELDISPELPTEEFPKIDDSETGVVNLHSEIPEQESSAIVEENSELLLNTDAPFEEVEETTPEKIVEVVDTEIIPGIPAEEIEIPVGNVNVEHEEPSNNLESVDSVSDYGKSLKFPEENETENKTEIETTAIQSNETVEPKTIDISSEAPVTVKIQKPEEVVSTEITESKSEVLTTEKNLYYNANDKLEAEKIETVTVSVIVEEQKQPSLETTGNTVIPTKTENLFKSLDEKLGITEEKLTTKLDIDSTTVKPIDISETTLKNQVDDDKTSEKVEVTEDSNISVTFHNTSTETSVNIP